MKKVMKRAFALIMSLAVVLTGIPVSAAEAKAADYTVTAEKTGNSVVIGNDYISREFSVAGNKVSTVKIINKRTDGGDTVFAPAEGSEEFIIRTTKTVVPGLDKSGWTAYADTYQGDGNDGPPAYLIDGNVGTIWHSAYNANGAVQKASLPFNVVIDLGEATEFQSFAYTGRGNGSNGRVNGYKLYVYDGEGEVLGFEDDAWGTAVATGNFANESSTQYINLDAPVTATQVRLEITSSYGDQVNKFGSGAEIDLYAEPQGSVAGGASDREFAASALTLVDTKIEDTEAVINNVEKSGKMVTFSYAPYTFKGVEYSIDEVVVMYDGDHFMRKYMEISVPDDQKTLAEIDYIDLESLAVNDSDAQWTIPTDAGGVVAMDRFKANLGQPIYIQGMFFGCEFPVADTQIVDGVGYMRYYTGKTFERFEADNQLTTDGKYVTWQTVAGAARSTEQEVIQADFFEYIKTIATPSDFRIQYNSWFDNMMYISDENILESFIEVDKELNAVETRPLDSYVVDDGWNNYNNTGVVDAGRSGTTLNQTGFWEFNDKFPNGLTTSSDLVHNFGSNFGVWVGPRGGYNFYGSIADILTESGKGSKAGGSIDVADREYVKNFTEMAVTWQKEYGVNYWKWDGFADQGQYNAFAAADGVPGYANRHMTGGYQHMYHVTDLWEAWIDLMEACRDSETEDEINRLWISLTCYVNPSPWFLQWANSVWMQCVYDQKDAGFGTTKLNKQLTYRDAMYYDFIQNHEFQFPLSNIYNHDPIYGKEGTGMGKNTATDEDFKNYLYMQSTRGTAFWELYYSDSIMTEGKYEVTAEYLEWAEENYHMLQNAKMIGGTPDNTLLSNGNSSEAAAQAYGFSCFDGTDGIISVRNPHSSQSKDITFTFDRNIGVAEGAGTLKYHIEHSYNLTEGTETTGEFVYGETYTMTLKPNEVRLFMISKDGDTVAPKMTRAYSDGENVITVKFDEKVTGTGFEVAGATVASVEQSADDITYRITLESALADGAAAEIVATDIKDLEGNACENSVVVVHNAGNVVALGAVSAAESLYSNNGFTVVADVATTETGAVVAQGEEYALGVNEDGTAYFTLNGATATTKAVVNDGEAHQVVGVKENNGILKIYVDGTLEGAGYNEENRFYQVQQADITVSKLATAIAVYDIAYGYDEVAEIGTEPEIPVDREVLPAASMKVSGSSVDTTEAGFDKSAANAIDGDETTFWATTPDGTLADAWYVIELDDTYKINQVDYTKRFDASAQYNCTGNLLDIIIEVSTDGETWTQVAAADTVDGTTTITFNAVDAKYVRVKATKSYHWKDELANTVMTIAELAVYKAIEKSVELPLESMTATTGDYEQNGGNEGPAEFAIDNDETTIWHTDWDAGANHDNHWLQLELDGVYLVDGFKYLPRQDSSTNGRITKYEIQVSMDGEYWDVVASGDWDTTNDWKEVSFDPVNAKYVRLQTVEATSDQQIVFASAAEVRVIGKTGVTCTEHTTELRNAKEATCTEDGYTGDLKCTECGLVVEAGKVIEALGHDWSEWTVITEATHRADGSQERTCSVCEEVETKVIAKLANPFVDVTEDQYWHEPVMWALDEGITDGTSDTTFSPDAPCTRAHVVTFLWRNAGKPAPEATVNPFADVIADAYYVGAVLWAVENGITDGTAADAFSPDVVCNRGQTVTFLYRAID